MTAEKAEGLDDRHQRERYADRRGGAGSDPGDEERVRHVVKRRYQHADNRRHGSPADQAGHGLLRHRFVFFLLCYWFPHIFSSFNLFSTFLLYNGNQDSTNSLIL